MTDMLRCNKWEKTITRDEINNYALRTLHDRQSDVTKNIHEFSAPLSWRRGATRACRERAPCQQWTPPAATGRDGGTVQTIMITGVPMAH